MCAYEQLGLLLFIVALVIVYLPAIAILGRRVVIMAGVGASGPGYRFSWWEKTILAIAAFGALAGAYGYFIEPYWVEVTHHKIASGKLYNFQRPIRIVHISDLHSDPDDRLERRLPTLISAERPDLIVFTGDSINSKKGAPVFRRCLSQLAAIAPTYAVLGNHDTRCWSDVDLFKNTKVKQLNGTADKVSIGGQDVYLAGVAFDSEGLMDKALSAVPPGAFTMFLYHSPDLIMDLARRPVDVMLTGHTHGGQVCLPFYGAVVTQSKFGKQFESGMHKVSNTWMYVNRGIGMEGGMDPRIRFLARPEITVIDLQPESRLSLKPTNTARQ